MNAVTKIKPGEATPVNAPASFAEAFVKLQAAIKPAVKDATNPAFRSKYADLSAVWEAVRGPLADNGFCVIQSPDFEGQDMWLKTTVLHVSGESVEGRYPLRPTKQDPQGFGSALTYAKRYSLAAMLGVVADEDDDGNAASQRPAPQAPTQREVIHGPSSSAKDPDIEGGVRNWCDKEKHFLNNCQTVADVTQWQELRANELDRLKKKAVAAWSDLIKYSEARIEAINKGK